MRANMQQSLYLPPSRHSMTHAPATKPQPPEKPLPTDCCGAGCTPCVFEVYSDALTAYKAALKAWEARQSSQRPDGEQPSHGS